MTPKGVWPPGDPRSAAIAMFARHPDGVRSTLSINRDFVGPDAQQAPEARLWCGSAGYLVPPHRVSVPALLDLVRDGVLETACGYYTGGGDRYGMTLNFSLKAPFATAWDAAPPVAGCAERLTTVERVAHLATLGVEVSA